MIKLKLPLSLVLLAVVSLSACSSNSGSDASNQQSVVFEEANSVSLNDEPSIASLADAPLSDSVTASAIEYLRIKHYKVECEGYQVGHCLLVQKEGSDDWTYLYETIEGFDYQWGNDYEVLVEVRKNVSGMSDTSDKQYTLIDVITATQFESEKYFDYTALNLHERIVEVAPGMFSLLGSKEFTCTGMSCDALRSAIDQNHSAVLSFQHSANVTEPLVLNAVLCTDAASSFTTSCK